MDADFEEFTRKVKEASRIEEVIDGTGAEFRLQAKHGKYLHGLQHDSLVVNVDEQFYVWNQRSETGDVFSWLEKRHNWDFMQALEHLAQKAGMGMPTFHGGKSDPGVRLAARVRGDVFEIAAGVFAKWLWADEEVIEYCRGRGWSDETIKRAGLGFSGRVPAAAAKELGAEFAMHGIDVESPAAVAVLGYRGDVVKWGERYLSPNPDPSLSGDERQTFGGRGIQSNWVEWGLVPGLVGRKRLVYAHWNGGRCEYLSGRNVLGDETNSEGRTVKSFNPAAALVGKRRVYFNHVYGRGAEVCVVVEGQADAVTLGQWGVAAAALAGTSWKDHAELLRELRRRHERVYIGMDGDAAGLKALVGEDGDWPLARELGGLVRVVGWGNND